MSDRARVTLRRDTPSVEVVLFSGAREVALRGGQIVRSGTCFVFRTPGAVVTANGERVEPYELDGATRAAVADVTLALWERLRAEIGRSSLSQVVELPPLRRPTPSERRREHRDEEFERWA